MKLKLLLLFILAIFTLQARAQTGFPFDNEVRHFKKQDSLNAPKPGGILFIGSSSIKLWDDLEKRFAGKPIIKRGLGGSQLCGWVNYYLPYVVFPYKPKKIFFYAGENDIAAGRKAEDVLADFKKLHTMLRDSLPKAKIYYMAIKPSNARKNNLNEFVRANDLVKAYIRNQPKTKYVDVSTVILSKETMLPDGSLFKPDQLHLNSKGYDRWEAVLKKYVN
ncbi:MAG: hypothetical protein EOP47_24835 [Sphingobacteriaceae bacterium]|nr:MAG: hypothetical protein EOP47_24835 [Sphingobacteriaceae bacterium]